VATYILRRLIATIPVLILVTFGAFALIRIIPGDLATLKLGADATPAEIREYQERLGLTDPIPVQYVRWLGNTLRGDLGESQWEFRPVTEVVKDKFPVTMELAFLAIAVSTVIAIPFGIVSAVRQDSWLDQTLRFIAVLFLAIPVFWLGVLLITLPSIWFNWKPPLTGYVHLWEDPIANLQRMIWPALVIGASSAALVMRLMRSSLLEVLRQDYIRTAWAKGLQERSVIYRHALKGAMIPVITILGLQLSILLGGTVIAEQIFSLPGMGRSMLGAILQRDYELVQSYVFIFAVIYLLMNLLVDLVYGYLDPRIRYG
jgi:peptide/nickel transport system permease protein